MSMAMASTTSPRLPLPKRMGRAISTCGANKVDGVQSPSKGVSADLQLIRSIYQRFHLQCRNPQCQAPLFPPDANEHIKAWLANAQRIPPSSQISELRCNNCHLPICVGCGRQPDLSGNNIFTPVGVVNHCCQEGKIFGFWLLLTRCDDEELARKKASSEKKPQLKFNQPGASGSSGIGYTSNGDSYWNTYDPWNGYGGAASSQTLMNASKDQDEESPDVLMATILKLLIAFLPDAAEESAPSAAAEALSLLRLSFLFDRVAELIRNDSITDMVERRDLYNAAFGFVDTIAMHPGFVELLFEKRPDKRESPGLGALCTKYTLLPFESKKSSDDLAASLFTCGNNVYRQAKAFIDTIEKTQGSTSGEISNPDNNNSVRICKSVIQMYENLQKVHTTDPKYASDEDLTDLWTKFGEDNRVTFTDDVLKNHAYHTVINATNASAQKGRLSTIGKEIANMTTSLPAGIFLKIAESRSDVMKVLIVGTEDSPYAGGLFVFDLFLDGNYPVKPPLMKFVLPGNDSDAHSFNPNLHRGGGVCLSILNTWRGSPDEMWQPNKSTILAILISIQAMVLGAPIPYINEPGWQTQGNSPAAQEHKLLIQYKTVRYAMIGWLSGNTKQEIWQDISEAYWKYNGSKVLHTVKEWALTNGQLTGETKATTKKKRKGKAKATEEEPTVTKGGVLVEKLAELLGLGTPDEADAIDSSALTIQSKSKGGRKRKASTSDPSADSSKGNGKLQPSSTPFKKRQSKRNKGAAKKEDEDEDEDENMEKKWVYTGSKTQKEIRGACKEFGIAYASTIKESVAKLEKYVNENDLSDLNLTEDLVEKWGSFV